MKKCFCGECLPVEARSLHGYLQMGTAAPLKKRHRKLVQAGLQLDRPGSGLLSVRAAVVNNFSAVDIQPASVVGGRVECIFTLFRYFYVPCIFEGILV